MPEPQVPVPEQRAPPRIPGPAVERRPSLRRTNGRRRRVRVVGAVVALLLVALVVKGLWPEPATVETASVRRGALVVTVDEDGRARVRDRYVVSSPQAGTLERVTLRAGDAVSEGQVVARLQPLTPALLDTRARREAEAGVAAARARSEEAAASVVKAQAALELAETEARRMRALEGQGAASRKEREQADAEEAVRRAELTSALFGERAAKGDVARAAALLARGGPEGASVVEVRAPVAGIVLKVERESAGAVQAGESLLDLGDPSTLELVVDVLTTDAASFGAGAKAVVEHWGGDGTLSARVRRIEPSGFTTTSALGVEEQRVNVLLDITEPRERYRALGDGYRVEVSIVAWEGRDVLQVPGSAVFRFDGGWAVFVVDGGRARRRRVEVGRASARDVEIRSGLEVGERVIVHPGQSVEDGARVEG